MLGKNETASLLQELIEGTKALFESDDHPAVKYILDGQVLSKDTSELLIWITKQSILGINKKRAVHYIDLKVNNYSLVKVWGMNLQHSWIWAVLDAGWAAWSSGFVSGFQMSTRRSSALLETWEVANQDDFGRSNTNRLY